MFDLARPLFLLFAALVEARAGLHYESADRPLFADKLAGRLEETDFENALDYYYFLRYDPNGNRELDALVDALVVNETYLFREVDALTAAVDHVVRPAVEARGRARIWSAGCATGDEPFTLAMMLADRALLEHVDLVATDISSRAIAKARSGRVSTRGVRSLLPVATPPPPPWAARIASRFLSLDERGATIDPAIVGAVQFRRESLLGPAAEAPVGPEIPFDLILCRNVLIYFRDAVVLQVVDRLARRLRPGGKLVVGASESLLRFGTLLRCEERAGAFFYVKDDP